VLEKTLKSIDKTMELPLSLKRLGPVLNTVYYYQFHKEFIRYNKQLNKLRNKHKDERCFIIGTGPSLKKTNLSLINDEILFGVNTLYRGLKKFGINCQYWAVGDRKVFIEHYKPLLSLNTTIFLGGHAGQEFLEKKQYYLKEAEIEPIVVKTLGRMNVWGKFGEDLTNGTYSGGNVVITSIQIAFHLGFKEVYLLGCDSTYKGSHHFDGEKHSFQKERKWSYIFAAYELCKKTYENTGRKIYNSTVGGQLEVFERKSLEEVMR